MKKFYLFALLALVSMSLTAAPMGLKKAKVVSEDEDPTVIVNPEGEKVLYDMQSSGWVYWFEDLGLQYESQSGIRKIVWGEDGKVYINTIVNSSFLDSYVEGEYADGKITVKFPQCVGSYWDDKAGDYAPMFVNKMAIETREGNDYYMIVSAEDNYAVYDVAEDGTLTLNLGNQGSLDHPAEQPECLIGLTYSNEPHALQVWAGFGDAYAVYVPKKAEDPVTPPADAKIEKWAFDDGMNQCIVPLAWDGNDIYFGGLVDWCPDYWVKGTVEGDKIVLKSNQFLGINEWDQFFFFVGATIVPPEDEWGWDTYEPLAEVYMDYDAEAATMTSAANIAWLYSGSKDSAEFYACITKPKFWKQSEEMLCAAPENPTVVGFSPFEGGYMGMMSFDIPNVNVKGAIIDGESMYYNVYVDGEIYEFDPELYPCFDEVTTDIPYTLSDYYANITVYGVNHTVYFAMDGIESIGVQSFYTAPNGETYHSDLVTYKLETEGINAVQAKTVDNVTYYNLSGVAVENPESGLYITVTKYTDGSTKVNKVIKR